MFDWKIQRNRIVTANKSEQQQDTASEKNVIEGDTKAKDFQLFGVFTDGYRFFVDEIEAAGADSPVEGVFIFVAELWGFSVDGSELPVRVEAI